METEKGTNNLTAETFVIPRTKMVGIYPRFNLENPGRGRHKMH